MSNGISQVLKHAEQWFNNLVKSKKNGKSTSKKSQAGRTPVRNRKRTKTNNKKTVTKN